MKYLILAFLLGVSLPAAAADSKSAQQKEWADEYQYGAAEEQQAPATAPAGEKSVAVKKKAPKAGKPSEGGEFEIAPKK